MPGHSALYKVIAFCVMTIYSDTRSFADSRPTKVQRTDPNPPVPNEYPGTGQRPRRDMYRRNRNPFSHGSDSTWVYPPEFWDGLMKTQSTIQLEPPALEEFDRRNRTRRRSPPPSPSLEFAPDIIRTLSSTRGLARFARHGGPDLRNLRGFPHPATFTMDRLNAIVNDPVDSTTATTPKTKKSTTTTAYNRQFDDHMTPYGIHTIRNSRHPDLKGVKMALVVPRPSLSPSRFPESAFETFQTTIERVKNETEVYTHVLPFINGPWEDYYPSTENMAFGNLDPLTDGSIPPPKPDMALGAESYQLHPAVRNELQHHIIPAWDSLMAPNFFIEAKGPNGSGEVMRRQACYDGAVGARAMHSLQNFGAEEPVYNGRPYTYSATYHDGTLRLYAHHVTAPKTSGSRPEYHMTQIRALEITDSREAFIQGVTVFRNARDLAKQHRDAFIEAANAKYQTALESAQKSLTVATEHATAPNDGNGRPSASRQLQEVVSTIN